MTGPLKSLASIACVPVRSGRCLPAPAKPKLSKELRTHLQGFSIGHGDGYQTIIQAFEAHHDKKNSVTFVITGIHGLFLQYLTLQCHPAHHKNQIFTISAAILQGCKLGDRITVIKETNPYIRYTIHKYKDKDQQQFLFELKTDSHKDGFHLIKPCKYTDTNGRYCNSYLLDGIDYAKRVKEDIANGALANARKTLNNCADKLTSDQVAEIIKTAIAKGDNSSLSLAKEILGDYAGKLTSDQVAGFATQIIKTAIAKGDAKGDNSSLFIALKTLKDSAGKLTSDQVAEIIKTAIAKGDNSSLSIAKATLRNYAEKLTSDQVADFAIQIVKTAIAEGDNRSLVIASEMLKDYAERLTSDQVAGFATQIIKTAIAKGDTRFLSIASETLKDHAGKLTSDQVAQIVAQLSRLYMQPDINLDLMFDHINNGGGSVLTIINALPDESRLSSMRDAIKYFNTLTVSQLKSLQNPLKDILLNDPLYFKDQHIRNFIIDKLMSHIIEKGLTNPVQLGTNQVMLFCGWLNSFSEENKVKFMLNKNLFFIQLLYQGLSSRDNALKTKASELASTYEKIPEIKACLDELSHSRIYEPEIIDSTTISPAQINIVMKVNNPTQLSGITHVCCDGDYFAENLFGSMAGNWTGLAYLKVSGSKPTAENVPATKFKLIDTFEQIPIFKARYDNYKLKQYIKQFMKLLFPEPQRWDYPVVQDESTTSEVFLEKIERLRRDTIYHVAAPVNKFYLINANGTYMELELKRGKVLPKDKTLLSDQDCYEFFDNHGRKDFASEFLDAAQSKSLDKSKKMISEAFQTRLNKLFDGYLTPQEACQLLIHIPTNQEADPETQRVEESITRLKDIALRDEHLKDIYRTFDYSEKSNKEKAQLLLCLAELFAKYSSSSIFGTHDSSPEALRRYAYALIKKAHELDNAVVSDTNFTSWQGILLGLNGAFTCTAVLADKISDVTVNFKDTRNGIIPADWS